MQAWGPGAEWAIDAAPDLVGARDDLSGFEPVGGPIRRLHRTFRGLRITRSRAVFEAIVPSVIEQKIPGKAARRSYRDLVLAFGEPAPEPGDLRLPPSAERLAAMPYYSFHPIGIERRRAGVISHLASRARYLDSAADLDVASAQQRLQAFPGVGPWTAAEVAVVALGDADAVSLGDYHLPHQVAWVLAGERRGTDERMLELLEPYRGHRGRVLRLIGASDLGPPRRGPGYRSSRFERSSPASHGDLDTQAPLSRRGHHQRGRGRVLNPDAD